MNIVTKLFLALTLAIAGQLSFAEVAAATYYLDSDGGSNTNSGTSPAAAWQTLAHASAQTFQPGDQILLQRGDTFVGTLLLDNESGTEVAPIIVGAYGTGDLPVINAAGYLAGVNIRDVEYIEVQDLEITADGGTVMDGSEGLAENDQWNADKVRYGVYVNGIKGTPVAHVTLRNLYIHDIFPTSDRASEGANPTTYWGYGIKFSGGAVAPGNWDDGADGLSTHFLMENCTIERTGHRGIHGERVRFLNIIDNVLTDIGGPGIQPSYCDDLVVRSNVVTRSGSYVDTRMHGRGSGIWPWSSERVLIEKNTFRGARGRNDSCGVHIDWDCSHVVVQYNLSIDNSGGFLEILGGTYNNTYRYNISINDGSRKYGETDQGAKPNDKHGYIIWLGGYRGSKPRGGPTHSYIYNNTIYVGSSAVDRAFNIEDTASGALIANNIFYIESDTFNGTTASNDGPYTQSMIDSIVWDNNLYQRTGIIPASFPFAEDPQTIGDPLFVNKGGLDATDYIPTSESLIVDQGISITPLAGDSIGLQVGLTVTEDFFGNPVVGLPDMGAVEVLVHNESIVPDWNNYGVSSVTTTAADAYATLINTNVTSGYLYWDTTDKGENFTWAYTNILGALSTGLVERTISGLTPETTYYARFYGTNSTAEADGWSDVITFTTPLSSADYDYSMQISFTNFADRGTLTNFPALVKFNTNDNFYAGFTSAEAHDLRFCSEEDGTGVLNYEIEEWNTNGESFVWVQIPELTHNCSIWAYWGSASAVQPAYATNGATWSEGYVGVWHMNNDGGTGIHEDSVSTNDATEVSDTVTIAGMIGDAQEFDGNSDEMLVANESNFDFVNSMSIEVWTKVAAFDTQWQALVCKGEGSEWRFHRYSNGNFMNFSANGEVTGGTAINDGAWHHLVVNKSTVSGAQIYENGDIDGNNSGATGTIALNDMQVRIGENPDSESREWEGIIDEVRISSVVRSSNWVWACYQNQGANHDSFVQYGEYNAPPHIVLIDGTDNVGTTTDGDGYTLNGSFETVDGTVPTFWQVYPGAGNQGSANVQGNHTPPGTDPEADPFTAIIGDDGLTTQAINTHQRDGENRGNYTIVLGDTYTLSFKHAGAWEWDNADNIDWSLFYTADNTANGAITTLFSGSANTSARTGSAPFTMNWQTESVTTAAVSAPGAVGKHLWLGFQPVVGGNGQAFGRIDEVNLTSTGIFPPTGTVVLFR